MRRVRILDHDGQPLTRAFSAPGVSLASLEWIGPRIDDATIADGLQYNKYPWAYAAIRAIATAISSVPFRIYEGKADKAQPVADDHPLQKLFDRPNSYQSTSEFWTAHVAYLKMRGEAFTWMIGASAKPGVANGGLNEGETPIALWPLDPKIFEPANAKGEPIVGATEVPSRWRVTTAQGVVVFEPWQVIRIGEFNPANPLRGLASLDVSSGSVNAAYASTKTNEAMWANGANLGGWVKTPYTTQKQLDEFKNGFEDQHRGPSKAGRMAYTPKDVDIVPNPANPKDLQFLEGLKWWRDEVLATVGVPKAVLAITDDLNYATHLGQTRVFWENTVLPLIAHLQDALWHGLFSRIEGGKYWGKFDTSKVAALQSDFDANVTTAQKLVGIGYSANDANERMGLGMKAQTNALPENDPLAAALTGGDVASPAQPAAATVADTALNGAQVTALQGIVESVAAGMLPADAAKLMIVAAFPTISEPEALTMVESAQSLAQENADAAPAPVAPDQPQEPTKKSSPLIIVKRGPLKIENRVAYIAEYTQRAVIPIERKYTGAMRRYLSALSTEQLKRFERWMERNGVKAKDVAKLSAEDVDAILFQRTRWDEAIQKMSQPYLNTAMAKGINSAAEESGSVSIPLADPAINELRGNLFASLVETNTTTQNAIRLHVQASQAQGETIAELQARIVDGAQFSQARALLIARTETGMGSSGARFVQTIAAGIDKHEWVNAGSGDIRESHQDKPIGVGGEVVELGKRFSIGLLHPHEMGSEPGEVCNCRCEALAVL